MRYVVGIFNGVDVDDYYVEASSIEEAYERAEEIAINVGGSVYTVVH